ncbi:MAG: hypothetical protein A2283_23565 [Lentisphaerae bacterium RIFOXYA12_FULL_48_11]|nr:MAG: hypothetical protein A2283_23565 [Lentisphaerae bacterium RIFOXYA12_FULL_48_11]
MDRRQFLKATAVISTVATVLPDVSNAADSSKAVIYVVHGRDITKMVAAGMEKLGGWAKFVKKGQKVTLKPNVAWISKPEQGADTDPVLVSECVKACKTAGASEVVVPEKSVNDWKQSFGSSGVLEAVNRAGGRMYALTEDKYFRKTDFPDAKILKQADVAIDVLDTGCLVNMPIAKSHSGTTLTLGMKNWMGSVKDRQFWHRNKLHQCIADCCTVIKPVLTIMDATRIMLTKGPRGPGEMERPDLLIFGTDPVAVDAYSATLFKKEPFSIEYIKIAHDMGLGCGDLSHVDVVKIEA